MIFQHIISPFDGQPRWYWKHPDDELYERIWHGPFRSERSAQEDAAKYEGRFR